MKNTIVLFVSACFLNVTLAQIAPNYSIGTWKDFKPAAVTYTLDDNCSNQIPVALPLFDKYNFKVTFCTVINWGPNWTALFQASANGHEIASHTLSHPSLPTLSLVNQDTELKQSQITINSNITNAKCLTVAYPSCNTGDLATIQKYYIAGRICSGQIIPSSPTDFYNLSSFAIGSAGTITTAASINSKADAAKTASGWCVYLIHGIDNDGGYSPTQSTELSSHLSYVNTNAADFWVGTFVNVVKYIKERNAASLTETVINNDSLQVLVAHNLDNTIYNFPISIRRALPTGWQNPKVYSNGKIIASKLSVVGTNTFIEFEVAPNQGPVNLANSKSGTVAGTTSAQMPMAKCKGKYLGNVIQSSTTSGAGLNYNNYWNQATSENGSKWGSVEATQNSYNWSNSDIAYNWAKNNNGLFKYHNFVWGSQTPSWVASATTATLTASVENYIKACSTHYAPMGGISLIDVLNEPIKTAMPGNYKAALTAGYKADPANAADINNQYGWIIWPYQLARKYFPNATLLINEYSIENDPNGALVTYAAMVNAVKNAPNLSTGAKNLIDGIGLQCHAFSLQYNGAQTLSATSFKAALDKLYSLTGLPMHITEFDADADANETIQKNIYQSLITVAWEHPNVAGITFWGYVQGQTWRNGNGITGSGGTDSGILLADGTERPALTWLKSYMASKTDLSCCPAPAPFATCSASNIPPTVSLSSPTTSNYAAPATIVITAQASDADGTIASVKLYQGTTLLTTLTSAPYTYSWTGVAAGTYSITAVATDNGGAVTTTAPKTVTVSVVTGVFSTPTDATATCFPNPSNTSFTLKSEGFITYSITDLKGCVVEKGAGTGEAFIGNELGVGMYFLYCKTEKGTAILKILKSF